MEKMENLKISSCVVGNIVLDSTIGKRSYVKRKCADSVESFVRSEQPDILYVHDVDYDFYFRVSHLLEMMEEYQILSPVYEKEANYHVKSSMLITKLRPITFQSSEFISGFSSSFSNFWMRTMIQKRNLMNTIYNDQLVMSAFSLESYPFVSEEKLYQALLSIFEIPLSLEYQMILFGNFSNLGQKKGFIQELSHLELTFLNHQNNYVFLPKDWMVVDFKINRDSHLELLSFLTSKVKVKTPFV